MRYITLSCPLLAIYSLFAPTFLLGIPLICFCISDSPSTISDFLLVMFPILLLSFVLCIVYGRAFTVVICSEAGVKNRHVDLNFEKIGSVTVLYAELWKYSFFPIYLRMICLSEKEEQGTFYTYDKSKCILLPMNKKTFRVLAKFSKGKSEVIENFFERIDIDNIKQWKKRERFLDR